MLLEVARHIHDSLADEQTTYQKHFSTPLSGLMLPLEAETKYKPSPKHRVQQFGTTISPGRHRGIPASESRAGKTLEITQTQTFTSKDSSHKKSENIIYPCAGGAVKHAGHVAARTFRRRQFQTEDPPQAEGNLEAGPPTPHAVECEAMESKDDLCPEIISTVIMLFFASCYMFQESFRFQFFCKTLRNQTVKNKSGPLGGEQMDRCHSFRNSHERPQLGKLKINRRSGNYKTGPCLSRIMDNTVHQSYKAAEQHKRYLRTFFLKAKIKQLPQCHASPNIKLHLAGYAGGNHRTCSGGNPLLLSWSNPHCCAGGNLCLSNNEPISKTKGQI